VAVELSLPGLPSHLTINGQVVGIRGRSERFEPGVYVRFLDEGVDSCRGFLGLSQSAERYALGRKSRRGPCTLAVRFRHPEVNELCPASNISETGLLVACPMELQVGQYVELELQFENGSALPLRAEVSRTDRLPGTIGLRFIDLHPDAADPLAAIAAQSAAAVPPLSSRSIVVADDDLLILELLAKALSQFGYQIRTTGRGEEALSLVRELLPQLVLLDILMPGLDGVDLCKMMRADVDLAEIPVIFLSALDPPRLHELAHQSGATDYLTKPVVLAELLNVVGAYLKG
jgi:CheY-like chemotaxis protein